MDEFMKDLRNRISERFPGAVSVEIYVTASEVTVSPKYTGEVSGFSMRKIDGTWCSTREDENADKI